MTMKKNVDTEKIKVFLENYGFYLAEKAVIRPMNSIYEISLPFLDRNNDWINFYLKEDLKNKSGLLLTDFGETYKELLLAGFEGDEAKELMFNFTKSRSYIGINHDNEIYAKPSKDLILSGSNQMIETLIYLSNIKK